MLNCFHFRSIRQFYYTGRCCGLRTSLKITPVTAKFYLEYRPKKLFHLHMHLHCPENTDIHYWKECLKFSTSLHSLRQKMDVSPLLPPASVKGMTELNREAFQKKIMVPHMIVKSNKVSKVLKCLKKYLLKFEKVKPVKSDEDDPDKRVLLLNPLLVKDFEDVKEDFMKFCDEGDAAYIPKEITLNYENWKAEDILRTVLPENQEGAQSFSLIGHILHLNLRDHILPYKYLIGQVYLDKIPGISLVVNKTNNIDSTYRNFQMEILAGTGDTNVSVKENGCIYKMDFAKVYWNPRLSTEHERILKKLKYGDVLYDVMAGVGPFAIPAGRKKCSVLANDLNPHSYDALLENCSINKVKDRVKCFNLDGCEFIKNVLKADLLEKWQDKHFCGDVHVTMNLPAIAVEFLPAFVGLYQNIVGIPENPTLPLIHVYMFTKEATEDIAIGMIAENLGYPTHQTQATFNMESNTVQESIITNDEGRTTSQGKTRSLQQYVQEVVNIRQVAPNKAMMRVSIQLPLEILLKKSNINDEPPCKKVKEL